jgi:hypothetical protein
MQKIFLPHTNEFVDLDLLLSVCSELMQEWRGAPLSAATVPMPIYAANNALNTRLAMQPEYAYSFDVACRLISSQRNTKSASNDFFSNPANSAWFERTKDTIRNGIERSSGVRSRVSCVQFTQRCMDDWHAMPSSQRNAAQIRAQALLNADVEINGSGAECHILPVLQVEPAAPLNQVPQGTPHTFDDNANRSRAEMVNALVAEIQSAPFQPMYRRQPTMDAPVTGWDARLRAYYWPNQDIKYTTSCKQIDALTKTAETLARALQDHQGRWDANEEAQAVQLADAIFVWGGVRQARHTVTATNVRAVFLDALNDNPASKARMNSGWTKVAAFATAHLEHVDGGKPHVIWDSRVATALIGRLDRQLSAHTTARARALFPEIGTVPGRGGSRPRTFALQWPSGYQRWSTQVNGSALVREMRDRLNAQNDSFPRMPLPDGAVGNWTTRGVEMVLFMDGY